MQDDLVGILVIPDAQFTDHPLGIEWFEKIFGWRQHRIVGWRQVLEHAFEVVREHLHLLLLDLERGHDAILANLEVEGALPFGTHRAGGEVIGAIDLERGIHGRSIMMAPMK